jgi:uncharacterized YigZ family protein
MSQKSFFSVKNHIRDELTIKKSRFIADIFPVFSLTEINTYLGGIKKEFPDARHHCYAYLLQTETQILQKFTDDGEPGGTAGKPIYNVIMQNSLSNVLLIVTRYFGGIKLGAGGLTRAYGNAAEKAIKKAEKVLYQKTFIYQLTFPYTYYSAIENYLLKNKTVFLQKDFSEEVILQIAPFEDTPLFLETLQNISQGDIKIEKLEQKLIPWEK